MPKRRSIVLILGLIWGMSWVMGGCVATLFVASETAVYVKTEHHPTATVNLNATPDMVYLKALSMIGKNPDFFITGQDDANRVIAFSEGDKGATLKITPAAGSTSQLTVTSISRSDKQMTLNMVLRAVERTCKELNVTCRVINE